MTTNNRLRDIALKVFWTVVFTALGVLGVEAADLPVEYVPIAAGVLNVVGAWLRQQAGHYAPPPAEEAKGVLPQTRVGTSTALR